MPKLRIIAGLFAALAGAGLAAAATSAAPPGTVEIHGYAFAPETLTVTAGTTVTWVNEDETPHTVSEPGRAFRSAALDTGDADALVECFTDDCVMSEEVFEDPDIWEGHEGIRGLMKHYANAPGFPGRQHHVTQVKYLPQDDGSVKLKSFAFVTECEGEPPYVLRFTGWYDDRLMTALADGSARAFPIQLDQKVSQALIEIADGTVIDWSTIPNPSR